MSVHSGCRTLPKRQTSQFRDTVLSTHKYLSPPVISKSKKDQSVGGYDTTKARHRGSGTRSFGQRVPEKGKENNSSAAVLGNEPTSVLQIVGEQSYAALKAQEHRQLRASSEWALLDTFEVSMYNDEFDKRVKHKRAMQGAKLLQKTARQREDLDRQLCEREKVKRREEEERVREREVMLDQVAAFEAQQTKERTSLKQRNALLKAERKAQIETVLEVRKRTAARKFKEDQQELARAQKDVEDNKEEQRRKRTNAIAEMKATLEENRKHTCAKQEAVRLRAMKDEALMQEMLSMLERQEQEREESLRAFHERVAARSKAAGMQMVEEARERLEREEELLRLFQEEKEKKMKEKERADCQRRENQVSAVKEAWKRQLEEKSLESMRIKKELVDHVERVKKDELNALAIEAAREQEHRLKNLKHKEDLMEQIKDRETKLVHDNTGMSIRERDLNLALITRAHEVVGSPQILPLRPCKEETATE